ncbi:TonB-dependent receptor, plug [Desulfamplus magnetovallimortis]|uniref:TonB-dependent receptor, plug n=1 Tax=Desulfamplus magnetovallimortis TaxID=1246637 RepID=A0A1W1HHN1_9BACT|nr:TonB-dependent receptor plug domain-containing protein [Desulfamplus magnetovallimortis]SLM31882.1 TonB-dependent receptor, plug [Desulfamplus magnetovallimortis]
MNSKKNIKFFQCFVVILQLCIITFCFFNNTLYAEEKDSPYLLEDIVVIDSPIIEGNFTDFFASQKTVVTKDQIKELNAHDLESALRRTPGVNISRYNPVGSFGGAEGGGVFIRGMGSSRPGGEIKTLVDGAPMYMSVWNHPLLDLVSIDSANTIEVYKSPQPQYFGNALGVINLVPGEPYEEGFVTNGELSAGSYETWIAKLQNSGKIDRFNYYVGGAFKASDGHRTDADGELKNLYGRLGYNLSDHWTFSLFTLVNDNYAKDPGVEGEDSSLKAGSYETRANLATVTLGNDFSWTDGEIKIYRSSGEGDWLNNPTDTDGVTENLFNDFLFYGVKAKQRFSLTGGFELLAGIDWDYTCGNYDKTLSNGNTEVWEEHDFNILSPYVALNRQFGTKDGFYFIPSAGIRYYENSDFDSETAPHAGMIFGYKDSRLHMGYARGVIYPGLDVAVMSEMVIPMLGESWKDLTAEKTDHFEMGIQHDFGERATVDLTFFYEDGKNRYVIVPPPPPPPSYSNIESFTIQGVEASLTARPLSDLTLFTGVTWLDTDPTDLPYAPEFTFSAGLNWTLFDRVKLSMDCAWLTDMFVNSQARKKDAENISEVDGYFVVNGKFTYDILTKPSAYEVELFLSGENLTDTDYEYLPGYPMPGINCMAGITFKL